MPVAPLPEIRFTAHTLSLEEDEFALTIALDGRRSTDDRQALIIQFAIDPQDGEEPFLEIPVQQFAADGGLLKLSIHDERVVVDVDGEAGEKLGGFYRWTIVIPANRRADLITFASRAFTRHKDLLEIMKVDQ